MPKQLYRIEVAFPEGPECGYVGHPYTPDMYRYIEITKLSGMNRARSTANRRKALEEHLNQIGMTLADFEELERRSKIAFTYEDGFIVIPAHHVQSFLVATCDEIRSASRPSPPEQVRSRIRVTGWRTDKTEPDGNWERFALVATGTGAKLSNQRAFRTNAYITGFKARGEMSINADFVDPKTLEAAIRWGGENVGVGASRKMGWGRFSLEAFAPA
jgi:hypothetical protein